MNKEFVPYEQALALKELGFDEPCFGYYHVCDGYTKGYAFCYFNEPERYESDSAVLAPTFSQAFRWFREKYGLFGAPNVISYEGGRYLWFFDINSIILPLGTDLGETYDYETYEDAELECLKKLIEITKTK